MSRAEARGLVISASDFTEPAIHTAREFLQHKAVILGNLAEIVRLLETQDDLAEFLLRKVQAAIVHKNAESAALRTGFRRKPDSIPMIADSR